MTTSRAPSKIIPHAFPGILPDEVEELIKEYKIIKKSGNKNELEEFLKKHGAIW